jgi:hypothetical protein
MKYCATILAICALGASAFAPQPSAPVKTSLKAGERPAENMVSRGSNLNGIDYGSVIDNYGDYGRSGGRDRYSRRGRGERGGSYRRSERGYGDYDGGRYGRDGTNRYNSRTSGGYDDRSYRGRDRYRTRDNQRIGLSRSNVDRIAEERDYRDTSVMSRDRRSSNYRLGSSSRNGRYGYTRDIFDDLDLISVQGGSLRTCSFHEDIDRVTIYLKTEGRPLRADVNLWQGPDNTPQKVSVYLEDGDFRPFRCVIETPGSSNAVSIRNTGELEYPLTAGIELDANRIDDIPFRRDDFRIVQGGAVYTTPFAPAVQSVRVCLRTDGRPMNARVELLQGPNNDKQVMEIYSEDGLERPFNCIVDTPGVGNVVRIVNTATVEFPMTAALEPFIIDEAAIDDTFAADMTWS